MIASIVERLLHLHGAAALALVFLLPALESSAFLGFLFPGEIAVILGGVLASQGKFPVTAAMAAAVVGAVVGDSVGYAVGRRYGRRILQGTIGRLPVIRRRLDEELSRAEAFVIRRGAMAVIVGRLTAALRVLVPGLAGMAGMPYGRFVAANVTGGVLWGVGFTLAGYLAGSSWKRVQGAAGTVGLVFLGALIVGYLATRLILSARRRRAVPLAVGATLDGVGEVTAPVAPGAGIEDVPPATAPRDKPVAERTGWLRRRVALREPTGLPLTVSLLAMAATAVAFGGLLVQVLDEDVTRFDPGVLRFAVDHRSAAATTVMKAVTWLGSSSVIVPLVVVVGCYLVLRRRDWRAAALVAAAFLGAFVWSNLVKAIVERPRPPASLALVSVTGAGFPSGHATQAAAFYGMLALVLTVRRPVATRVAAWVAALVVVAAVGLSRVYLGAHWLSDVLGGYALGALWVAVLASLFLLTRRDRGLRRASGPTTR